MADDGKTAAYVSWVTFKNTLDRLGQSMPNRIDKSVFPGFSGGTLVQLLPALKFLGLIRDDGTPTEALRSLVGKSELERREPLREIFEDRYKLLFEQLDLTTATMAQLTEKMSEHYGVTGSTLRKALRFFLSGAPELGIPLSSYLVTAKGTGNGGTRRKIVRKKVASEPLRPTPSVVQENGVGTTSKTVRLETPGMTLTLIVPGNYGALTSADRRFVFDLMDQIEKYEEQKGAAGVTDDLMAEQSGPGEEV